MRGRGEGEGCAWEESFSVGTGVVTVTSGGKTIAEREVQLTPGPLVVVLHGTWPVSFDTSIEAIAASYVEPPASMAGVRLFNLSPNTVEAGWSRDGQTVANGVAYLTGSDWTPMQPTCEPFELDDFDSKRPSALLHPCASLLCTLA